MEPAEITYTEDDLALLAALAAIFVAMQKDQEVALSHRLYRSLRDRGWLTRKMNLTRVGARELELWGEAMTQALAPISSTLIAGSWGIAGAPTMHEAVDEGLAATDGNTSYIQGSSALGVVDMVFQLPIEPGGLRTGFSCTMRARRTGVVANPFNEPKIQCTLFKGTDPTVIATTLFDFVVGGNVFTNYPLALTALEAIQLWPGPIRVRLDLVECRLANTVRVTTLEFGLPDPNIVLEPVRMRFRFPTINIGRSGSGIDQGLIQTAGATAGHAGIAGAEAGWISEAE